MIILDAFPSLAPFFPSLTPFFHLLASLSPLSISAMFGIATLVSSITAALGFAKVNEAIIFLVKMNLQLHEMLACFKSLHR